MVAETSYTYRINDQVKIELVLACSEETKDVIQKLEYGPYGLKRIGLSNFTGQLLFYQSLTQEEEVVFYEADEPDATSSDEEQQQQDKGGIPSSLYYSTPPLSPNLTQNETATTVELVELAPDDSSSDYEALSDDPSQALDDSSHHHRQTTTNGKPRTLLSSPPPPPKSRGNMFLQGVGALLGRHTPSTDAQDNNTHPSNNSQHPSDNSQHSTHTAAPTKTQQSSSSSMRLDNVVTVQRAAKHFKERTSARKISPERKLERVPGGIFRKINLATDIRCHIPDNIRLQRNETRLGIPAGSGNKNRQTTVIAGQTQLHILCGLPNTTLSELFVSMTEDPTAVRAKDSLGRYPLHCLGDNETMINSIKGRETATVFANHLINEFPGAALTCDNDGFIPFARIISDWIAWATDKNKWSGNKSPHTQQFQDDQSVASGGPFRRRGSGAGSTGRPGTPAVATATSRGSFYYPDNKGLFGSGPPTMSMQVGLINFHVGGNSSKKFFPRVEVWEECEWAFTMLSTVLEVLGRNQSLPMFQIMHMNRGFLPADNDDRDDRSILVQTLADKLPKLMYTVLLVDDDGKGTRTRVLNMRLFRRLFICYKVVGKWLVQMLNHGGVPAQRAVDYLDAISNTKIEDYTGGFGAPTPKDWECYQQKRMQVFDAVGNLKGTIASLVTLDTKETERAASTAVIWHNMNRKLSRNFVLGLVLIDLMLHLVLMVAFRSVASIDTALSRQVRIEPDGLVYVISIHYLLRKSCEAWVLLKLSMSAFRAYFSNMWTVIDLAAIVAALWATIWEKGNGSSINTGMNAMVVGLLWLKVLGFLKVVNKEMSTFILALTQILYDIRLFMIVLTVCVLMFGDMFYIAASTKDDGYYCDAVDQSGFDTGAMEDFCKSSWDSYLRTYSILLGDFELDDLTATAGTTVLFVIFTIFGVVILLNVLIAVISDSYQNATKSGSLFFGRSRILYVAQNEALEEFLKPRSRREKEELRRQQQQTSPGVAPAVPAVILRQSIITAPPPTTEEGKQQHEQATWQTHKKTATYVLRWAVLITMLGTAVYTLVFLTNVVLALTKLKSYVLMVCVFGTALVLFCALWVASTNILDGPIRDVLPQCMEKCYGTIGRVNSAFVGWISNKLFGLDNDCDNPIKLEAEGDDLNARVKYLEGVILRAIKDSKTELRTEILEMKSEMNKSFKIQDDSD